MAPNQRREQRERKEVRGGGKCDKEAQGVCETQRPALPGPGGHLPLPPPSHRNAEKQLWLSEVSQASWLCFLALYRW